VIRALGENYKTEVSYLLEPKIEGLRQVQVSSQIQWTVIKKCGIKRKLLNLIM